MARKINIKGDIVANSDKWVYDWLGIEAVSPQDVAKELNNSNGEDIEIDINSGGGDIFAGSEIYTAIRTHKGNVQINIVGLAASAASVIAMAGKSRITPTGLFMIHNVAATTQGDYRSMKHSADVLKTANQSIANAYKEKTGLTDAELFKLMDNETWLSAEEAVKNKFVDDVMFSETNQTIGGFRNSLNTIPYEVIEKIKNKIKKPDIDNNDKSAFLMQSKLNLLKIKGDVRHD